MVNSLCGHCEHGIDRHEIGWGACDQDCIDPDTGEVWKCVCIHFERDADD